MSRVLYTREECGLIYALLPAELTAWLHAFCFRFSGRHKTFADLCDEMADTVHDLQVKEDLLELEKS